MLAASSPELFVGRHVLLRLCVPRYPPSALIRLTNIGVLPAIVLAVAKTRLHLSVCSFQGSVLESFQQSELNLFPVLNLTYSNKFIRYAC